MQQLLKLGTLSLALLTCQLASANEFYSKPPVLHPNRTKAKECKQGHAASEHQELDKPNGKIQPLAMIFTQNILLLLNLFKCNGN